MTHIVEIAFYVDRAFKLVECTTDVEKIIKQTIWAVYGNFQEIIFPVAQYHTTLKTGKMFYGPQIDHETGDLSCSW